VLLGYLGRNEKNKITWFSRKNYSAAEEKLGKRTLNSCVCVSVVNTDSFAVAVWFSAFEITYVVSGGVLNSAHYHSAVWFLCCRYVCVAFSRHLKEMTRKSYSLRLRKLLCTIQSPFRRKRWPYAEGYVVFVQNGEVLWVSVRLFLYAYKVWNGSVLNSVKCLWCAHCAAVVFFTYQIFYISNLRFGYISDTERLMSSVQLCD